jgi:hypothetical protein
MPRRRPASPRPNLKGRRGGRRPWGRYRHPLADGPVFLHVAVTRENADVPGCVRKRPPVPDALTKVRVEYRDVAVRLLQHSRQER